MNRLVIVGNGFDLAHNLETRYTDFLLWYINKSLSILGRGLLFDDKYLMRITCKSKHNVWVCNSVFDFYNYVVKRPDFHLNYSNPFVNDIFQSITNFNWVDIETKYYESLKTLYFEYIKAGSSDAREQIIKKVNSLNASLEYIKNQLEEYLAIVNLQEKEIAPKIVEHISDLFKASNNDDESQVYFLNFNYTSTIEYYKKCFNDQKCTINHIHGKINDKLNPIIFGYGDEIEKSFNEIEQLNRNEFLEHIKSFSYFKTSNYQNILNFIDRNSFDVFIMGHSCGISDRILLKCIFEHDNCSSIKIYYHKTENDKNDFIDKTKEISRHFSPSLKNKMRRNIIPITKCESLS